MQENPSPDTPQTDRKGLSVISIICITLTALILISAAIMLGNAIISRLETRDGRMAGMSFPYEAEGFTIESVKTSWRSSEGDERLALRASFYPTATVTLKDIKADGVLLLSFANSENKPLGNMTALRFTSEGFTPMNDACVTIDGKTATIILEGGYAAKDDFYLHCIDESQPLWRLNLAYKMTNANNRVTVGYTSISPEN